jgi:hypothetical protein
MCACTHMHVQPWGTRHMTCACACTCTCTCTCICTCACCACACYVHVHVMCMCMSCMQYGSVFIKKRHDTRRTGHANLARYGGCCGPFRVLRAPVKFIRTHDTLLTFGWALVASLLCQIGRAPEPLSFPWSAVGLSCRVFFASLRVRSFQDEMHCFVDSNHCGTKWFSQLERVR